MGMLSYVIGSNISSEDNLLDRAQSSLTHQRLHNCRVLQRNFKACVEAAQVRMKV